MDRLVIYVSCASTDGHKFRLMIVRALRPQDGVLPEHDDQDVETGVGGADVLLLLLTEQSVIGDDRCETALKHARKLDKPILVVHRDPLLVPRRSDLDSDIIDVSNGPGNLLSALREFRHPSFAADACRRVRDAWLTRGPGSADPEDYRRAAIEPIENEIARHEERARDSQRLMAEVADQARAEFEAEKVRIEAERATPRAFADRPFSLTSPDPFHDRDDKLKELTEKLNAESTALLTLRGRPGIGKTALVLRLGETLGAAAREPVLYLTAHGNAPLSATMLLSALATLVRSHSDAEGVLARIRDPVVPLSTKLGTLAQALIGTRVVVVVDNADELMDEDEEEPFLNQEISRLIAEIVAMPDRGIQLILVGGDKVRVPRALKDAHRSRIDDVEMVDGLPNSAAAALVTELDHDRVAGLADAKAAHIRRLLQLVRGSPRNLELVYAVLRTDPSAKVPDLLPWLERWQVKGADHVTQGLIDWVLNRLSRAESRVLQTLAVFAQPVSAVAVDIVVRGVLPGFRSEATLARLTDLRIIRRFGDRFLVARTEEIRALVRLPQGGHSDAEMQNSSWPTVASLSRRAANYFRHLGDVLPEPHQSIHELQPRLRQIQMLRRARWWQEAFDCAYELDERYLLPWEQSHLLVPVRRDLDKNLDEPDLKATNSSLLAIAYSQLGRHEDAFRELQSAKSFINAQDDDDKDLRSTELLLQTAANLFERGDIKLARDRYNGAVFEAQEIGNPNLQISALSGLLLCDTEQGRFLEAVKYRDAALDVPGADSLVLAQLHRNAAWPLGYLGLLSDAHAALDQAIELNDDRWPSLSGECAVSRATLCMDEENFEAAAEHATRATRIGGGWEFNRLSREANVRLAMAELYWGNLQAAREAADAAVRFRDSRRSVGSFAIRGLVAFREDDGDVAIPALQDANVQAVALSNSGQRNFEVWDWRGMVQCLLAIYELGDVDDAVATYRQAREFTIGFDVPRSRSLRLLRQVQIGLEDFGRDPSMLDRVWRAAGGED
jgi:tetratricopeptide (TPR) repeat protein